jgi:hypothetical protein
LKYFKWGLLLVGWNEIIFGVIGIITIPWIILRRTPFPISNSVYVLGGILFPLSLLAGILILKKRAIGFTLSIVINALQILKFDLHNFNYQFSAGLEFLVKFGAHLFQINPGFHVGAWCGKVPWDQPRSISINLLSLMFIWIVCGAHRHIAAQQGAAADVC